MYETSITILTREDLITEKSLKKFMKMSACGHGDGVGVKFTKI